MKKKIYLDDVRTPIDKNDWVVVRNYDEFVDSGIENCALGKSKSSGGYIWKYISEIIYDVVSPLIIEKSGRKKGSIPWNKNF